LSSAAGIGAGTRFVRRSLRSKRTAWRLVLPARVAGPRTLWSNSARRGSNEPLSV
jgi:hypothetical protein